MDGERAVGALPDEQLILHSRGLAPPQRGRPLWVAMRTAVHFAARDLVPGEDPPPLDGALPLLHHQTRGSPQIARSPLARHASAHPSAGTPIRLAPPEGPDGALAPPWRLDRFLQPERAEPSAPGSAVANLCRKRCARRRASRSLPVVVSSITAAVKSLGQFAWAILTEFMRDNCPQMAAALSYYTVFSLPPLLILLILMIEPFLDPQTVTETVRSQVGGMLGPEGAAQVETMIRNVSRPGAGGPLATGLSIGAFVFGATVAFAQLQAALNAAWEVGPDPTRGDIKNFILKRVLSFAMILAIGFLMLVSLVLSAAVAVFAQVLSDLAPSGFSAPLLLTVNHSIAFAVTALLFAAMFRYLPDAVVAWRDALVGGVFTALLFSIGRLAISLYLGQSNPGSVYGAAGSLAVVFVWIYYSSMILLLGAEFTQLWAKRRGFPIVPVPGAVRVILTQERVEPGTPEHVVEEMKEKEGEPSRVL